MTMAMLVFRFERHSAAPELPILSATDRSKNGCFCWSYRVCFSDPKSKSKIDQA
jgi:hypothetical protein